MAMGEKYVPPADAEFADDDPMLPDDLKARRAAESGTPQPYEPPPDAQEEGQEPSPPPSGPSMSEGMGRGKAAAVTGLQGLTGGYSDDLAAAVTDLYARYKGADPGSSRERARDRTNRDIHEAHARFPTQSLITQGAGELAKDAALGVTSIPGMAVSGAVSGYGNSQAPTFMGRLADAETGMVTAGALGAGGKLAAKGVGAVLPNAESKIAQFLEPARQGLAKDSAEAFDTALRTAQDQALESAQKEAAATARAEQQAGQQALEAQAEAARKEYASKASEVAKEEYALRKKVVAELENKNKQDAGKAVAQTETGQKSGQQVLEKQAADAQKGYERALAENAREEYALRKKILAEAETNDIPLDRATIDDLVARKARELRKLGGMKPVPKPPTTGPLREFPVASQPSGAQNLDPATVDAIVAQKAAQARRVGSMKPVPEPPMQGPVRGFPERPPDPAEVARMARARQAPVEFPNTQPTTDELLAYLDKQRSAKGPMAADMLKAAGNVLPFGRLRGAAKVAGAVADRVSKNPDPYATYARLLGQGLRNERISSKPTQLAAAINALLKARNSEEE